MQIPNENRKILNAAALATLVLTFGYCASASFLANAEAAGFNALLTGVVYLLYSLGTVVILNKTTSTLNIGMLIGLSLMVVVHSLETAIYWGQAPNVIVLNAGWFNLNKNAMRSVCTFSSLIFIVQSFFAGWLIRCRQDILDSISEYENIPDAKFESGYESISKKTICV